MIKLLSIISISLVLFCSGLIVESHQTHVSKPVLSIDKTQYKSGDTVVLSGWVNYEDNPTSDVLLRILVIDPKESTIFDGYVTSKDDGTFVTEFSIPENSLSGIYQIDVTSHCREVHRDICTYKNEFLTITIEGQPEPKQKIPDWVRNIFIWYAEEQISEDELLNAIQFLIDIGILESS